MEKERRRRLGRVALAALALAAAGGALLLARPPCLIREATGYYCGACGFTRMVEELLHGHVGEAFRQNPYMFFVLPLGLAWLLGEVVCCLRGSRPLYRRRWAQLLGAAVAAVGLAFTVVRNLPGFEWLRPL